MNTDAHRCAVGLGVLAALGLLAPLAAAEDAAPAAEAELGGKGLTNPFFVFDNGLKGRGLQTAEAKAKLMADLGYDGVGWRPGSVPQMFEALDVHGLRMFTYYIGVSIDSGSAEVPPNIRKAVADVAQRDVMIWLFVTSRKHRPSSEEGDAAAVEMIRKIADLAAESGLRVALYPHTGFWVERVEDAVRVTRKVARENVGVTFNLCHWLKVDDADTMLARLDLAMPHMFAVSINGADTDGANWRTLIQTLDRGTFDVYPLLLALRDRGYYGPVGLQCYAVRGDAQENLTRSIEAWRGMSRRFAAEWTDLFGFGGRNPAALEPEEEDPLWFAAWREPLGDWELWGDAKLHPEDARRLTSAPGPGAAVNGVRGRTRHLVMKEEHGDVEAHVEFTVPKGSNSGVYFMGRYEIQVLDSWGVEKLKHGDCGGIYQRWRRKKPNGYEGRPPRVNASRPPGEWQSFDVVFRAPRFDGNGEKIANAVFVKVVHNGVTVHENEELTGPTRAAMFNDEKPTGPMMLQGDHGPVAYRNVRIRPLR